MVDRLLTVSLVILVVLSTGVVFVLRASSTDGSPPAFPPTITLSGPAGAEATITVEVAATQVDRERGLMERKTLEPDHGMLFVFTDSPRPQRLSFWMKDTQIPLDILFFHSDGTLVSTASMQPCAEDACDVYRSDGPASYALEVPGGFIAAHGIDAGWRLQTANFPPSR